MSSTYTVTIDIDVVNQTITSSDPENVTVPTSNFDIVTFDGKSCIKPNSSSSSADFDFNPSAVASFTCKIFLQAVNNFTLFCGVRDVNNTLYSLVYHPYGQWYNPDKATFDPNNDLVGTWVTVTYSSSAKTLSFDNGTTVLTRILADLVNQLSMAKFNEYNVYLTDMSFEIPMPESKYVNGSGVAEIWANTKNYVASQLLSYYTKEEVDTLISNIVGVSVQEVYTMGVLSDDVSTSIRVIEDDTDTSVANYSTIEQAGDVDVL